MVGSVALLDLRAHLPCHRASGRLLWDVTSSTYPGKRHQPTSANSSSTVTTAANMCKSPFWRAQRGATATRTCNRIPFTATPSEGLLRMGSMPTAGLMRGPAPERKFQLGQQTQCEGSG